jgi:hypothetical protein
LLASGELLAEDVARDGPHLRNRYWHVLGNPLRVFYQGMRVELGRDRGGHGGDEHRG